MAVLIGRGLDHKSLWSAYFKYFVSSLFNYFPLFSFQGVYPFIYTDYSVSSLKLRHCKAVLIFLTDYFADSHYNNKGIVFEWKVAYEED